jgi:propionyl-CoA carboxylase beta chain
VADSDEHCLDLIRHLMEFIPQNNTEDPPFRPTDDPADRREDSLKNVVPENPNQPYDIKDVITAVVDDGHFFEVHAGYAQNLVVGFAHLGGFSAGIVANQPASQAGALDTEASKKGARFVRFCDCFNIPLIILEDVPGFLPGSAQEYAGIILHGAKLIYAFCEATVPKITVITRKAYGGAYCVMNSKHIRGDLNYAFPTAEIAVMGPDGAVNIIFRGEIKEAKDKKATKEQLVADYRAKFASPYKAAELGYIDEVILPEDTRPKLIAGLQLLQHKRDQNPPKKHGNIPL